MRPVNLIPSEERAGTRKPMRGGPLAYIVVGALALALIGVALLVTTSNTISDRKAEITTIESEISAAKSRAESLRSYIEFHHVREQRLATITSLADSRFDWERVMRELSLILPSKIWLTGLTANAGSGAAAGAEGGGFGVSGPSLNLDGCATSQSAVAGFIEALKEIDGVTRVGMQGSAIGGAGASTGSATTAGCATAEESVVQFKMTVAFDAAPSPTETTPEAPAPVTPSTSEGEGGSESEGEGATTSEPASTTTSEATGEEG